MTLLASCPPTVQVRAKARASANKLFLYMPSSETIAHSVTRERASGAGEARGEKTRRLRRAWRRLERIGIRARVRKSAANESPTSTNHDAHRRRIGPASFRECPLGLACPAEQRDQAV